MTMGVIHHPAFPPAAAALIAARLLDRHSPGEIGAAIDILIDVLNLMGGDPEAETGDDLEDDFALSPIAIRYAERGPGCAISDQDAGSYIEWHTMRGSQKRGPNILAGREDDEDDDPAEHGGDEADTTNGEDELIAGAALQFRHRGPGCLISDSGGCEHDGREPEDAE